MLKLLTVTIGMIWMFNLVLFTCEDCDPGAYQIYEINEIPNTNLCEYKTRAMTSCAVWRDKAQYDFVDTCGTYLFSEYFEKQFLIDKYPK